MTSILLRPPLEGVPIAADDRVDALLAAAYEEHHVRLVRLAYLLLGDSGRSEDVVQDSFVAVYQRLLRVGPDAGPDDLAAYLRQTVVNRARSALRHLKVVRQHPEDRPPDDHGADRTAVDTARRRDVLEALATLPRRQREVVVLRYYLDLSEHETARTLGISQGAVKSHASRGSAALRPLLSAHSAREGR